MESCVGAAYRKRGWIVNLVWRKVKRALSHPHLVLKQIRRANEQNQASDAKCNVRLLEYQIAQAESAIAQIQQAYESKSSLYTTEEAARRVGEYRDRILRAAQSKKELETSLERIMRHTESAEQTMKVLTKIHLGSIRNATFEGKVRVIEILDVKVYPSENLDHIGVTCAVNLAGLEEEGRPLSCYKVSIASPKL